MTLAGQSVDPQRYAVIPRTLSFLFRADEILLIRRPPGDHAWAGLLNGVGGHIERGEEPCQSARREIEEEIGLRPSSLKLAGVVLIDVGSSPGIALYVFSGHVDDGQNARAGTEGTPEWHALSSLDSLPLVEDLPALIPKALAALHGGVPFCAAYHFGAQGSLQIRMAP
jgi:8-oxo-dGTP diphosphatase